VTPLLLVALLAGLLHPAQAAQTGFAARHSSLARVARVRGLDPRGVLFASPIASIGTRLCVSSARHPEQICGTVVDGPKPEHRAWQIETGRIIEVQPEVARRLCRDASGPPRDCPVSVTRP
jgi:hypothetical protein